MTQNECLVHYVINHLIENDVALYEFRIKFLLFRFALWDTELQY